MELVHAGAIVPAAVAACCAVGTRRRAFSTVLPSIVMLLSMIDVASGTHVLWPIAWAVILVVLAPLPVIAARRTSDAAAPGHSTVMPLHASLGLVTMAGLTVLSSVHPMTAHLVTGTTQHSMGSFTSVLLYAGFAAFISFTLGLVAHLSRRPRRELLAPVEVGGMGLSLLLMAVAG